MVEGSEMSAEGGGGGGWDVGTGASGADASGSDGCGGEAICNWCDGDGWEGDCCEVGGMGGSGVEESDAPLVFELQGRSLEWLPPEWWLYRLRREPTRCPMPPYRIGFVPGAPGKGGTSCGAGTR